MATARTKTNRQNRFANNKGNLKVWASSITITINNPLPNTNNNQLPLLPTGQMSQGSTVRAVIILDSDFGTGSSPASSHVFPLTVTPLGSPATSWRANLPSTSPPLPTGVELVLYAIATNGADESVATVVFQVIDPP